MVDDAVYDELLKLARDTNTVLERSVTLNEQLMTRLETAGRPAPMTAYERALLRLKAVELALACSANLTEWSKLKQFTETLVAYAGAQ